jgi:hypothetical protein
MTLPKSFLPYVQQKRKYRGILIGTDGLPSSGKTEFLWSAPAPAIHIALDRMHRATVENQAPPPTRVLWEGHNMVIREEEVPSVLNSQADALKVWVDYLTNYYRPAMRNEDARSVFIDGDSDSWDLQFMAEFGRTNQIPQLNRAPLNLVKRAMLAQAVDSGKIVITTSKVKKDYEKVLDDQGRWIPDPQQAGSFKSEWYGNYKRQGYADFEYLYEIQLRHHYEPTKKQYGIEITMCKANRDLEGETLWGDECNLPTLLQTCYPHVDLSEWGY